MAVAQFLGAFNDNVCKQLALFICLEETKKDQQALATAIFAIPFLFLSGAAGFLADRFSKSRIVRACKAAEVGIQATGLCLAALMITIGGLMTPVMLLVLFLMGMHSAVFGPPKYGILPEMLAKESLPKANGVFLSTTFFAIIFGWVVAGGLWSLPGPIPFRVMIGCTAGVAFAIIGWSATRYLRPVPPARPTLSFGARHLFVDPETWRVIFKDRLLLGVLAANGTFFGCGAAMQAAVTAFGRTQLEVSGFATGLLLANLAFGIAAGCTAAGYWCGPNADVRVAKTGAFVIVACLLALTATPSTPHGNMVAVVAAGALLFGVGFGAGLYAVPLQVVVQTRPPPEHKGRVLGALSCFNWTGVLVMAAFYEVCLRVRQSASWPPSAVFAAFAGLMLIVAVMLPARVAGSSDSLKQTQN